MNNSIFLTNPLPLSYNHTFNVDLACPKLA